MHKLWEEWRVVSFLILVSQMYCRRAFQKPLFIKWDYIINACINDNWSCVVVRFYKPECSFGVQEWKCVSFLRNTSQLVPLWLSLNYLVRILYKCFRQQLFDWLLSLHWLCQAGDCIQNLHDVLEIYSLPVYVM